jgi:hypothetical protein
MVKILGMTLCLCLIAVAMDVVWGYCGILSLGHFAFFGLGGYAIGMWLMYARTQGIVTEALLSAPTPPTESEITDAIATQIFGVVGSSELPALWGFAHSLPLQLAMVVLVPGLLALVFGWLAFRSRVTGVYLSILTQAMTLALSLYLFQNESGLRAIIGPNGAGKTTFMDIVTGKTRPDEGRVIWGERNISLLEMSESAIAQAGIGPKFQKPTVFEAQSVRGQLCHGPACPARAVRGVAWRTRNSLALWVIRSACVSSLFTGTNRMDGRDTASQIASASAASVLPRFT